jgi:hypothetical protein
MAAIDGVHEEAVVNAFVVRPRRERMLTLLQGSAGSSDSGSSSRTRTGGTSARGLRPGTRLRCPRQRSRRLSWGCLPAPRAAMARSALGVLALIQVNTCRVQVSTRRAEGPACLVASWGILLYRTPMGIDHSELMLRQASRRKAQAIRAGRVQLLLGPATSLPRLDEPTRCWV